MSLKFIDAEQVARSLVEGKIRPEQDRVAGSEFKENGRKYKAGPMLEGVHSVCPAEKNL